MQLFHIFMEINICLHSTLITNAIKQTHLLTVISELLISIFFESVEPVHTLFLQVVFGVFGGLVVPFTLGYWRSINCGDPLTLFNIKEHNVLSIIAEHTSAFGKDLLLNFTTSSPLKNMKI